MILLKPVFHIIYALLQFKHAEYKLETDYFFYQKPGFNRTLKIIIGVQNQLPIRFSTDFNCIKDIRG